MSIDELKYGQGPAKLVPDDPTDPEYEKDMVDGITDPNLHRRIDEDLTVLQPEQVEKDTHSILIGGTNSFRSTEHYYHDEESTTSEVP